MTQRLVADTLGAQGDGIARLADGATIFLPGILPGETVTIASRAAKGSAWSAAGVARQTDAPDRVTPPCPHFGTCGGCVMQHLATGAYNDWKRELVTSVLARAGFALPAEVIFVPAAPGERRRMDLALRRAGNRLIAGLHKAGSTEITPIDHCLVLAPTLLAVRQALEAMSGLVCLRREGSAVVNLTEIGPDILLRTDRPIAPADYHLFANLARATGASRISWALRDGPSEPVFAEAIPTITIGGAVIRLPPGCFLQATAAGARAITDAVLADAGKTPRRIIELYAGIGTLTFALATRGTVTAYEGASTNVAAINAAAAGRRIEARLRDLARQPLTAAELSRADLIVLDPPHAGAAAQMPALAASGVPRVIYVSCHPASLARDAAALRAAGYRLEGLTVIDQFLWSTQVESVAVFTR